MNDYRHVCFKDLENYFKIDDYFGNLTDSEKRLIRENLQIEFSSEEVESGTVYGTYEEIKQLVDSKKLLLHYRYVITDYQTIYQSNTGETWGLYTNPSKMYSIILTPTSDSTFDNRVSLLHEGIPLNWEVTYDFTQEELQDGTLTKGKITYLKDQNNNSAYYDFKNIRFRLTLKSSEVLSLQQDTTLDLYTFSKLGNSVQENSDDVAITNNHFEQSCYLNVFLGTANNNHFYGGFKNNLFIKDCSFNKFEWNTTNNKFTESVMYTQGSLKNALVNTTMYDSAVNKEFRMIQSSTSSEPVFVVTYLDGDTLTNQVYKLNSV